MPADLSGSPLRRRSLARAKLAFASISASDLRGVDFSGADLHGADLSRARLGMSHGWTALVVLAALALSLAVGALAGVAGRFLHELIASDDVRHRIVGIFVAVSLLVFLVAGIWKGLRLATRVILPLIAAVCIAVGLIIVISGAGTGAGALAAVAFVLLAAAIVTVSVLARAAAGITGALFFAVVAISGALIGRALGGGLAAFAVAIGAMLMARRSAKTHAFPILARWSTALACRGGTRFRDADLSGAHFDGARVVASDFRGARLEGASFEGAEIRLCRFDQAGEPGGGPAQETKQAVTGEASDARPVDDGGTHG